MSGVITEKAMRKGFTLIEALIILVIVLLVGSVVFTGIRGYRAKEKCLAKGYPEVKFGGWSGHLFGDAYCVKRQDQTDVVVRLDSLK